MLKPDIPLRRVAPAVSRYGLAVFSVAASVSATFLLQPSMLVTPLFFPSIILSTWFGGTGPGLLAVLLSTVSINYFFLPPLHRLTIDLHDIPYLAAFLVSALLVSSWSAARRRAEDALRRARGELEATVHERTADLRRSNEQLQIEIAERGRAAASLRESEEQWRAVFEHNPTMYFMVDAAGIIVSVNPFGAEQLGYTVSELGGRPVLDVFYEADREAVRSNVATCFEQLGRTMSWECRKVRTDGTVLWVRETAKAVLLKGRPVVLVVCEDITARKRAEEELKTTERRLGAVIATTPIVLFALDRAGVFMLSEGRGLDALGLKPSQVVGQSVFDVYRDVPRVLSAVRRALAGEPLTEVVAVNERVLETHFTPFLDAQGEIAGVNGVAIDITARKRAEEALHEQASLLDLTHDTIFVRDMHDVITFWNRGAEELYGWTREEAVGKVSHQLMQTVFPAPLEEITAELLRTGRWEGELIHTRQDGTQVVAASRWALRRDESGNPVAVLETNNDITARKRAEEELRTVNAELEQRVRERTLGLEAVNTELEAFAYSVSHDLRAPLRHMAGYAELLQKHASASLDEKSQRYLTMILDSAKHMGNLIDDLLAFSRIGRAEIQKTMVSLEQVVKEAVSEVRQETEGRDIVWRMGALPTVHGDRALLRLAFVNLIANAVKFTRARPHAEIEIGSTDGKKDEVVVFIRDNGVGFDMKYVNKLFGVFQRLHRADEFEGTGIGLATVQRIIHRHGGRVWAEGLAGRGATFYFSVPKA